MPTGENLAGDHQAMGVKAARGRPRIRLAGPRGGIKQSDPTESMDAAVARYQRAKADVEELDAQKRSVELARLRGDLVPVADVRDKFEALHIAWVTEIEQLPHVVATGLPAEISATARETVRATIERGCLAMRERLGGAS